MSEAPRLVIGNKNLSSWSLRPWLALKHAGVHFEEVLIPLDRPQTRDRIRQYSASGRVPVLIDGTLAVWDSLAICEYVAEKYPHAELWPRSLGHRALARSYSAEMHSGFANLRQQLPMNLQKKVSAPDLKAETWSEVRRIESIWKECLEASSGPFLFGSFTIVDAMFAPVVTRFHTYSVPVDRDLDLYMQAIMHMPAMRQWISAAQIEDERI